jgi:UDP-2-acetamido-3-amino-2,3-dideoxy-glucuronate N-acetyltransferase
MADPQIHPNALCESEQVGAGSRIQPFAHVSRGARIGRDCSIGIHSVVGDGSILGDRVVLDGGVRLGDGVRLEDDVSIGANATVLAGLTIRSRARVAAGAVVTRPVPPHAIVTGNPAQIVGYVGTSSRGGEESGPAETAVKGTSLRGVNVHRMHYVEDMRGNLSVGELGRDVPFDVKRYFLVYDVPNAEVRGEHAHLRCHQFLIAVKGSLHVVVDDGQRREEIVLDRPSLGLHVPPMVWGIQYRYSADAVLLVLASEHYDAADYIRDYDRFLALVESNNKA